MSTHNLYLDCNSIIYDAVRNIDFSHQDNKKFEAKLIKQVSAKIREYIALINPTERVFIAFDGVAPVAKLKQQRNRRYKSMFQKKFVSKFVAAQDNSWDTTAITPGTNFMKKLGNEIQSKFSDPRKLNVKKIIVSTSNDVGEGEHKIYEYIRDNAQYHSNTTSVIYGLDADLIMLTLNHLHIAPSMFLFRETPHFIKSIDKTLNPNSNYLLDIPEFKKALSYDLNGEERIFDYIFLCFFLGNDFLPHFPSLNIRTTGIDRLLSAYRKVTNENVVCGENIVWKNVRKIVQEFAQHEEIMFQQEYAKRDKQSKNNRNHDQDIESQLLSIPLKDRREEIYINPYERGWKERYYSTLFNITINDERRKEICLNYLQGLEWTFKYYTTGCVDWRWSYKYDYPPLFSDLIKYVPYFHTTLVKYNDTPPVSPNVQLSYVLPGECLTLLPDKIRKKLLSEHKEWYSDDHPFCWAFCKYFWESHAIMPHISIEKLEEICN